jgi:hypothetical protein
LHRGERLQRVFGKLIEVGPEEVRGDGIAAGALAATQGVARRNGRPVGRMRREPPPHLGDYLRLRILALADR